jgi:hypothetical protein
MKNMDAKAMSKSTCLFVHFLCWTLCPFGCKENEPKEKAPVSLGPSDYLVLLKSAGSLKTRFAQTVQTPISAAFAVLSCVPMGTSKKYTPPSENQGRSLWIG